MEESHNTTTTTLLAAKSKRRKYDNDDEDNHEYTLETAQEELIKAKERVSDLENLIKRFIQKKKEEDEEHLKGQKEMISATLKIAAAAAATDDDDECKLLDDDHHASSNMMPHGPMTTNPAMAGGHPWFYPPQPQPIMMCPPPPPVGDVAIYPGMSRREAIMAVVERAQKKKEYAAYAMQVQQANAMYAMQTQQANAMYAMYAMHVQQANAMYDMQTQQADEMYAMYAMQVQQAQEMYNYMMQGGAHTMDFQQTQTKHFQQQQQQQPSLFPLPSFTQMGIAPTTSSSSKNSSNFGKRKLVATPSSILQLSSQFLGPKDVFSCVQVCKQWKTDIDNNMIIWKTVSENQSPAFMKAVEQRRIEVLKEKNDNNNNNNNITISELLLLDPLNYKNIAKGLVYKPGEHISRLDNVFMSIIDKTKLKSQDIIVVVEARDSKSGKVIDTFHQNFSNYDYNEGRYNDYGTGGLNMLHTPSHLPVMLDPNTSFEEYFNSALDPAEFTPPEILQDSIEFTVRCFRLDNGKYLQWNLEDSELIEDNRIYHLSDLKRPHNDDEFIGMYIQVHCNINPVLPRPEDWKQITYRMDKLSIKFRSKIIEYDEVHESWDGYPGLWPSLKLLPWK